MNKKRKSCVCGSSVPEEERSYVNPIQSILMTILKSFCAQRIYMHVRSELFSSLQPISSDHDLSEFHHLVLCYAPRLESSSRWTNQCFIRSERRVFRKLTDSVSELTTGAEMTPYLDIACYYSRVGLYRTVWTRALAPDRNQSGYILPSDSSRYLVFGLFGAIDWQSKGSRRFRRRWPRFRYLLNCLSYAPDLFFFFFFFFFC
ncbi:hypothetical protein GGR50DRAFT_526230 [Xylaria sp. CBS 124048]|nr:hypothetical protein GGR50DRAFT_526230 [Xylaria sp. CBS 124048]